MEQKVLLEVRNIFKTFGPTRALQDVSFQVQRGEVRGLIGENGSGKSTASSIISGLYGADSGEMRFLGRAYKPANVINARGQGVCMIVQEQSTIENITVAANIFIGKEDGFSRFGVVDSRKMFAAAAAALQKIGVNHIKPQTLARYLSFEDRKLVEIARAFYMDPQLLIVDETTTALSRNGRDLLYGMMKKLCNVGGAVIFISHDIDEVMDKSDSLTVLRDGTLTANLSKEEFSVHGIRNLMVGREISSDYYRSDYDGGHGDKVVLSAQNLSHEVLRDVSVELHEGEILGIGGLTDCGMHELGQLMFGMVAPKKGTVLMRDGKTVLNPQTAIQNHIGYMSKNRDKEALMTASSIRDNVCISACDLIAKMGYISSRAEKRFAIKWADEINVKRHSVDAMVSSLSGGNKQKVVFAKWLGNGTEIFIMDCPTRGIDVGVKAAIYRLMEKLKKEGKAILMISEELPELIGMSDRILILKDGRLVSEHRRDESLTEQELISHMI